MIVVIDGPSGSGKSSTAREAAARSGFYFLDSGAFYRCFTLAYLRMGGDMEVFLQRLDSIDVKAEYHGGEFRVRLDGSDVTTEIRDRRVSDEVSHVATFAPVRARVNTLLREVAGRYNIIADGRDLGTVVFPDADLKFYMVADLHTRAKRRQEQLQRMGLHSNLEEIHRNLTERDRIDTGREADPLQQADDAIIIDTTRLGFEEQVEMIISRISQRT
jgi:CMP/dCMP kinase